MAPQITSIYANTNGPRDAASCKIVHIALPTKHNYPPTRQRVSVDCKLLLRPRNVGHHHIFERYAQTPLNRFVAGILYNQVYNKYSNKSNRWSLGLSLSVASCTVGTISSSLSSTTLLISVNGVPWRIFLKVHSCACKNGSLEQNHTPIRGDFVTLCHDLI